MPRRTKTITFSLPPELAARVEKIKQEDSRTTSEVLREALRCYFEEREWRKAARDRSRKLEHGERLQKTSSA